jgi:mRNA interferase MazF
MASLPLELFDIVVVPFPFTDRTSTKRRPAIVISNDIFNKAQSNSVLAMITSAEQSEWLGDCSISDLKAAGLTNDCVIRLKLLTPDHRLIIRKAGTLGSADQKQLKTKWKGLLLG